MTAAIATDKLTKYYGKNPGILELDLEVHTGEVFGFLGPNGAGKTTTIRSLLDLIHPTSGSATVLGLDSVVDSVEIRRRTGYLPAELAMYDEMTARELVHYFGALRSFDAWEKVDALADRLELTLDQTIGSYSSGNRQKVGVIQAFMHEPELIILDEPTVALDPLIQQEFHRMVDEVRNEGRTVFLSSHVLPVVERLADRVGIVRKSRLVEVEEVPALKAKAVRRLDIVFKQPVETAEFAGLAGVQSVESIDDGRGIQVTIEGSVHEVMKASARYEIENVATHDGDLEDVFLTYYRADNDDDAA